MSEKQPPTTEEIVEFLTQLAKIKAESTLVQTLMSNQIDQMRECVIKGDHMGAEACRRQIHDTMDRLLDSAAGATTLSVRLGIV